MFCGSGSLGTAPTLSKGPGWLLGTQGSYSAEGSPPFRGGKNVLSAHTAHGTIAVPATEPEGPPAHERLPSFSPVMLLL